MPHCNCSDAASNTGTAGAINYEAFFGKSAPYGTQGPTQGGASAPPGSNAEMESEGSSDGDDHEGSGSGSEEMQAMPEQVLSTHERRQLKVAREIERVEGELMADKAWQFRGEATAKQRPKDSALEVDLVCHCPTPLLFLV